MNKYITVFHLTLESFHNHEVYYLLDDGRTWRREDLLTDTDVVKTFSTSREAALNWAYLYNGLLVDWPLGRNCYPVIDMVCDDTSVCAIRIYEPVEV